MERSLKRWFPLFLLPTLTAFIISFLVPFIMGIYLSFCKFRTVSDAEFIGFSNYVTAFKNGSGFGHSLLFTVGFAAVSVLTVNIFGFLLALALTGGVPGTRLFRTVFFLPNLIGGIVLGYIWQLILNGLLLPFGKSITSNPAYGFLGLVILMNWQMIGYMMIIYIAGLQNIPEALLEAARVDGASKPKILFSITLPSMMPSITICLFLTITNSFKLFDQNLALTAGAPGEKTSMLTLDIYQTFYGRIGFEGVGQAKAVVFFAIVAAISFLQLYLTRSREVES